MQPNKRTKNARAGLMIKIGVIGVQGAVSEHFDMLGRCGVDPILVRTKAHLKDLDGLIIPGGESTTINRLLVESGMFHTIKKLGENGLPIFGTCAGLILLAKKGDVQVSKTKQKLLGLMNSEIKRNAFGRQRESFESNLEIDCIGSYRSVFIRAPAIEKVWGKCKALAYFNGKIVAARQDNLLATSFHPELTEDARMHQYFISFIKK